LIVFDFLRNKVGFKAKNIFIFGRSIGTGPATYLAGKRNPGLLILLSPFTSIKKVAKEMFGDFPGSLVSTHFDNYKMI